MKYLKVFVDFRKDLEPLTDEERGRLFMAMMQYAETGEIDTLSGNERFLWNCAKRHIDDQAEAYAAQCERNKKNRNESSQVVTSCHKLSQVVTKDYESLQEKEKEKEKEILSKESKERSMHPSLEEVEEYVREAELTMDPRAFFDHFTSNGWKVGGKAPMKDWRAAARNWARRERPSTKNHTPSAYKNADLEKLEINLEEIGL